MAAREHVLRERPARTAAEVEDRRRHRQVGEEEVEVFALEAVERDAARVPRGGDRVVGSAIHRRHANAVTEARRSDQGYAPKLPKSRTSYEPVDFAPRRSS
jgi:hypothetical protein